jgi:hypothetical protein
MLLWKSCGGFVGDRQDRDMSRARAVDVTFLLIMAASAWRDRVIGEDETWASRVHRMSRSC